MFSFLYNNRKKFGLIALLALVSLGSACDKDDVSRNDFTGRYDLTEISTTQGSTRTYEINIKRSSQGNDKVDIENFYGAGITITGTLNSSRITIPEQSSNNFTVEGIGSLSGSDLKLTYDVQAQGTSIIDYCSATGKRK